jgi:hypothetical protein
MGANGDSNVNVDDTLFDDTPLALLSSCHSP